MWAINDSLAKLLGGAPTPLGGKAVRHFSCNVVYLGSLTPRGCSLRPCRRDLGKQFEAKFGTTLDDMATKGEIQLIYRTMTFLDNNLRNDSSLKAGIAAACADNAGAYSAYHNAIFAGQPTTEGAGYTTQQLRVDFAATAGITGDKLSTFQQCYDTRTTQAFVEGTNEKASAAGVNSTPTIMVNGTKLDNNTVFNQTTDAFRQTVLTTKGNG